MDPSTSIDVERALAKYSRAVSSALSEPLEEGILSPQANLQLSRVRVQRSLASLTEKYSKGIEDIFIMNRIRYWITKNGFNFLYSSKCIDVLEDTSNDAQGASGVNNCIRPWNYHDFLYRLASFSSVGKWFSKPDLISPIECARHGWINSDLNVLQCSHCLDSLTHDEGTTVRATWADRTF